MPHDGPDASAPVDDARFLTELGWFVLGASAIVGLVLDRGHLAAQVVRAAAALILLGALLVAARRRQRRRALVAGAGIAVALVVHLSAS